MAIPSSRPTLQSLPCVLMRAGTSKGPFIHRKDLPLNESDWAPHLLSALGSVGCDPRQIDGVGGGTSTTSKVAVVSPSKRPGMDVDFTFVQVAVGKEAIDLTGNCGNMISGVGPFALQEGLVHAKPGATQTVVRVWNTNTSRAVYETVDLNEDGTFREDGNYTIPGVSAPGSEIKVAFIEPAGSMTGKLFPSGQRQQLLDINHLPANLDHITTPFSARVTLIDSANPFCFVDAKSIALQSSQALQEDQQRSLIEAIRQAAAVEMGLAESEEEASKVRGTPKIALAYSPQPQSRGQGLKEMADIKVIAYSMGLPHPTLQLSGAVCAASALSCSDTVLSDLASLPSSDSFIVTPERTPSPMGSESGSMGRSDSQSTHANQQQRKVTIEHATGMIEAEIVVSEDDKGLEKIESCAVSRTARRLFEGHVRYFV